jgi:periplasmic divalent cation tolerance protein
VLIVLTTVPNVSEAESLAAKIIDARLAACVQVLPQMTSFYTWEGKTQREPEHLLLIKTLDSKYDELERFIRENHSYSVPEIVAIDAARESPPYLEWMKDLLS